MCFTYKQTYLYDVHTCTYDIIVSSDIEMEHHLRVVHIKREFKSL